MRAVIAAVVVIGAIAAVWLGRRKPNAMAAPPAPAWTAHRASAPQPLARHSEAAAPSARALAPTTPSATVVSAPKPAAAPDVLPRRLSDVQLSAAAERALRERESGYAWPRQYRATLDVRLEVFARMAECMGDQVATGQADIKLHFKPDVEHQRLVVVSADLQGTSLPTHDAFMLARYCVRVGMLGIEEPVADPALLTSTSIMYVDVHFPVASNPLFELLRSGEEPEIEDLTAAQYQH